MHHPRGSGKKKFLTTEFVAVVYFSTIESLAGDVPPRILVLKFIDELISYGLKIAGDFCPLSSRLRAYTLLNFYHSWDVFCRYRFFIIFKISHVKNRPLKAFIYSR
jgi:hypothetical protein